MAGIEKEYFSLEEIESQWGIPHRDLVYLAENGLLKVSVRLYGIQVENGSIEETEDGEWFSIPEERVWFEGLQDLRKHDVYRLFHEGQLKIETVLFAPYHSLKVNSLRENWPIERDFGKLSRSRGQQLQLESCAEAGNFGGNRLVERQLPIE